MAKITFIKGDATNPVGDGNKIIVHICNTIGAWGAGFVLALSRKWRAPEQAYRKLNVRKLGNVQIVPVTPDISVANMIAQKDVRTKNGLPPIRYSAVRQALEKVNAAALETDSTIHMPRIGCGLAGGRWEEIKKIIDEVCTVDVYVYDL